jgi:hypothetical protein
MQTPEVEIGALYYLAEGNRKYIWGVPIAAHLSYWAEERELGRTEPNELFMPLELAPIEDEGDLDAIDYSLRVLTASGVVGWINLNANYNKLVKATT